MKTLLFRNNTFTHHIGFQAENNETYGELKVKTREQAEIYFKKYAAIYCLDPILPFAHKDLLGAGGLGKKDDRPAYVCWTATFRMMERINDETRYIRPSL